MVSKHMKLPKGKDNLSDHKFWDNKVDKKYDVYVRRYIDDKYKGKLFIKLDGELIHSEDVSIDYGGPFGPDVQDVSIWCEKCIAAVDSYEAKSSKPTE